MTTPHRIHADDLDWTVIAHGRHTRFERKQLGAATRARDLGVSLFRLEPGKRSYPLHRHHGNEEALFILEGSVTLRLDAERLTLRPMDFVSLPAGGPAHQLINDQAVACLYLCLSTMHQPDVVEYVDSRKVGAIAGSAPGGDKTARRLFTVFRAGDAVDYWEGEDEA